MPYIELSGKRGKGHQTIVDKDIYKSYRHLAWYLSDTGYALRSTPEGKVRLHRLVIDAKEGEIVDHLNNNKLDNRKSNLRICSPTDNARNRSGVKGYTYDKSNDNWIVRYRYKYYGRYNTEDEAREAYKKIISGKIEYIKPKRKQWNLPTNITKQFGKYRVRPQRGKKRIWLGAFDTLEEAEQALNEWKKRG